MNKLTRITCAAAIALTGLTGLALAADNTTASPGADGPRHGFRGHRFMKALEQVGVTDAQKAQIKGIMSDSRPGMKPLVQQLRQERKALRDAIQATPVNEAAIRAQSARVAQIEADLAVQRAQIGARVRAVLTPDQIAKLKDLQSQWDAKREDWMNRKKAEANSNSGGT